MNGMWVIFHSGIHSTEAMENVCRWNQAICVDQWNITLLKLIHGMPYFHPWGFDWHFLMASFCCVLFFWNDLRHLTGELAELPARHDAHNSLYNINLHFSQNQLHHVRWTDFLVRLHVWLSVLKAQLGSSFVLSCQFTPPPSPWQVPAFLTQGSIIFSPCAAVSFPGITVSALGCVWTSVQAVSYPPDATSTCTRGCLPQIIFMHSQVKWQSCLWGDVCSPLPEQV